jgi:hypothetical protein
VHKLFIPFAAFLLLGSAVSSSGAVLFSGGVGSPLTVTVTSPLVFTGVTTGELNYGIVFTIAVVGNTNTTTSHHTGTATFASASGTNSGAGFIGAVGTVTLEDIFVYFGGDQAVTSATETFLPGTRTSDSNLNLSVAPSASFIGTAYLFDEFGNFISDPLAIPEPSQAVLLSLGLGAFLVRRRR